MNEQDLVLLREDGAVTTLTLNRPQQLNPIDMAMATALLRALEKVQANSATRLVVLRGAGKAFCGGGDVAGMYAQRDDLPGLIEPLIGTFHAAILAMKRLPMPVLACVHGAAAGGGFSLAMACDLVLASRSARFVVAYPKLGAPADGGLSFHLTRRLGPIRALESLALGGSYDAPRALAEGLINRVVDDAALDEELANWVKTILAVAPQSLTEIKGLVREQSLAALEAHLALEKAAFLRCATTADFVQRVTAFALKSKA